MPHVFTRTVAILWRTMGSFGLRLLSADRQGHVHQCAIALRRQYGQSFGVDSRADHAHSTLVVEALRSEEHTSELQSLMRISYAVFCLKKKNQLTNHV